jgi:hypothetical protein
MSFQDYMTRCELYVASGAHATGATTSAALGEDRTATADAVKVRRLIY